MSLSIDIRPKTFQKSSQNPSKTRSEPFKNRCRKRVDFQHRFFEILASIWEGLGPPTWSQVGRPSSCDDLRVSSIASRNKLRLTSLLKPILKVLGGQHGPKKRISEAFISMLFLKSFLYRILIDFWRLQIKKTLIFRKEKQ